jgi:hypothetical protein
LSRLPIDHDQRHLADPLQLLVEAQQRRRQVGRRGLGVGRQVVGGGNRLPLLDRVEFRPSVEPLDPAQGEAGGEDGQEAVAVEQQRQAVGEGDQPEDEELVQPDRFPVVAPEADGQAADEGAQHGADGQPGNGRPQQVDADQRSPDGPEVVEAEQAEAEHDEGEGGAVVHPGLAGQPEADGVAVARPLDLDVGGEHRVGRGEDGAEQDGRPQRQPQPEHADRRDEGDR